MLKDYVQKCLTQRHSLSTISAVITILHENSNSKPQKLKLGKKH